MSENQMKSGEPENHLAGHPGARKPVRSSPTRLRKLLIQIIVFGTVAGALVMGGLGAVLIVWHSEPLALPTPSGSYPVGRTEFDWVDPSRTDPLAETPGQKREVAAWVWYPAQVNPTDAPAPYLPKAWAQAWNEEQGIGRLIESDPTKILTHSYANAAFAADQDKYPVLMMQPGMGPSIPDYTVIAEDLASHGYIVVGLNTSYTSNLVVYPDGRKVKQSATGAIPDSADPATAQQMGNQIMAVWAEDVRFGMDQMQKLNDDQNSPFFHKLDLERIGVFGHSFGGATAIEVCQVDPRCKAGADLDGTPFSEEAQTDIPRPFLFMTEDYTRNCDSNCLAMRQMASRNTSGSSYVLTIHGAMHFNFSDLPLRLAPPARLIFQAAGYTGAIDPTRGLKISNAYLLAFFDENLKGIASPLLDEASAAYPEVQFLR